LTIHSASTFTLTKRTKGSTFARPSRLRRYDAGREIRQKCKPHLCPSFTVAIDPRSSRGLHTRAHHSKPTPTSSHVYRKSHRQKRLSSAGARIGRTQKRICYQRSTSRPGFRTTSTLPLRMPHSTAKTLRSTPPLELVSPALVEADTTLLSCVAPTVCR
jgi:hypothetical protein